MTNQKPKTNLADDKAISHSIENFPTGKNFRIVNRIKPFLKGVLYIIEFTSSDDLDNDIDDECYVYFDNNSFQVSGGVHELALIVGKRNER